MGAIFGIVGEGSLDEVRQMGTRMPHRGGNIQVWSPAPNVYFGECRRGPEMRSKNDAMAIDCQIDNNWVPMGFQDYKILQGNSEDNCTFIELLLKKYGIDGLNQVCGYFSLAYWDDKQHALILACDKLGFKIVYYTMLPGRFIFSTEYKSILVCPDFIPEPNRNALQYYQQTLKFVPGHTFLVGIEALTPGTAVTYKDGRLISKTYWRPIAYSVYRTKRHHEVILRDTLLKVIKRKLRPYNRIGISLSNGFDSPSLLACIRHLFPEVDIATYTVGNDEQDCEIQGARVVAKHFKTEHHEIFFSPERLPIDLPRLIWLTEDCVGGEEALFQLLVHDFAKDRESMVIGGHGSDMLFGGMPRHRLLRLAQLFSWWEKPLKEFFIYTQSGIQPTSHFGKLVQSIAYKGSCCPCPDILNANKSKYTDNLGNLDEYMANNYISATFGYIEPICESTCIDFCAPFMDPEVIEISLTIPSMYKVGLWQQKIILRSALRSLLPKRIHNRPKSLHRAKRDANLCDILDDMIEEILSPSLIMKRGLINPSYLKTLRKSRCNGVYSAEQFRRLWGLISMEIWAIQFLDRRGEPWEFETL